MVERILNEEQKIRRAEEIYYRRKNLEGRSEEYATLNIGDKRDYRLFKKMILQIIACLFIYLVFFSMQKSNYIFSEQFINKTKEILSYDINFEELKNMAIDYYEKVKQSNIEENDTVEEEPNIEENINVEESVNVETSQDILYKEEASSINQVKEDATYIKNEISLIKPLEREGNLKIWF